MNRKVFTVPPLRRADRRSSAAARPSACLSAQRQAALSNIDPDEDVTQGICIGEGLETCLSGRLIGYRPVWSVLTTSGVAGFPLLPGIDGLTIFGERDAKEQAKGPFGLVRKGGLRPEKTPRRRGLWAAMISMTNFGRVMSIEFGPPVAGPDGEPRQQKVQRAREKAKTKGNGLDEPSAEKRGSS